MLVLIFIANKDDDEVPISVTVGFVKWSLSQIEFYMVIICAIV